MVQITGPPGPSVTLIVSLGVPVPLIVGVVPLMGVLPEGEVIVGATGATVSTLKGSDVGRLVLPAGSVAVTLSVCAPSAIGRVGVQLHAPLALATAVQTGTPFSVTLTVLPGSAVPLTVGVLSFVLPLAAGAVTVGAVGAVLSTPKVTGGVVVVPLGLLMVATTVVGPWGNGVAGVQLQLPLALIVVVHTAVPVGDVVTVTWPPGVPVPVKVGAVVLTTLLGVGPVIEGETLLIANVRVAGELTLPAASLAVATTVWLPLPSAVLGVQAHAPLLLAVAVQMGTPPSVTSIVLFGSAVPLKVGVLLPVVLPAAGAVIVGVVGAAVSTMMLAGVLGALLLPAGSVAVAVMLCGPWLSGVPGVQLHVPAAVAVVVQSVVVPSFTVTVLLGSAEPESVGVVVLIVWPGAGDVTEG